MVECSESGGAVSFAVRVAPRAARTEIAGEHGGALKVRVAAPPVEGAANEELVRFLARHFGVPARDVEIVAGHSSKTKRVRLRGITSEQLARLASSG
ncbi:MAG TPA: DUF167 domain-containing protein [Pyrinomonadaceae bacterium]